MALNEKQQRFAEEYLIDLNATQAAISFYNPNCVFDAKTQSQLVFWSTCVLISKSISNYHRKKAALLILKYFLPGWRNILGDSSVLDRDDPRVKAWKKEVMERDGSQCRVCGETENLEIHHILSWSEYPAARIELDNGLTLCNSCHAEQHTHERQLILNRAGKVKPP